MGNTELCLREGPQAWEECLLVLEQTWEGDARAAEEVLQVTLRNDQSCLSQFEYPEMRAVPCTVIVKGHRNPAHDPYCSANIEAIGTVITRNVCISTAKFQVLGRCKQRECK